MSNLEHIIQAQQPLLAALQKAEKGEITVPDLKPLSSILGILPQRNNLLGTRIRITGGEISTTKFLFLGLALTANDMTRILINANSITDAHPRPLHSVEC